jgi:hypothetical protein
LSTQPEKQWYGKIGKGQEGSRSDVSSRDSNWKRQTANSSRIYDQTMVRANRKEEGGQQQEGHKKQEGHKQ